MLARTWAQKLNSTCKFTHKNIFPSVCVCRFRLLHVFNTLNLKNAK